jgi:hypothetical protein
MRDILDKRVRKTRVPLDQRHQLWEEFENIREAFPKATLRELYKKGVLTLKHLKVVCEYTRWNNVSN